MLWHRYNDLSYHLHPSQIKKFVARTPESVSRSELELPVFIEVSELPVELLPAKKF